MMRAIRFACRLNFNIAPDTEKAISRNRERIKIVSMERVIDEINKFMVLDKPSRGWLLMQKTGLLDMVLPQLSKLKGVEIKLEEKKNEKEKKKIEEVFEDYFGTQFITKSEVKKGINGLLLKFIFFVIGPLYGIIFLIGIFQMKSIMNALADLVKDSTVMFFKCNVNSNCNITITDDKSSVYDFYNYYYDYTMNETINFNLMMITAFIGGLLLRWKGFKITTGLLCIPSFGATVWLWNFNYNFKVDGVFDYDI